MKSYDREERKANALLVVISGPSGVGKDALVMGMKEGSPARHYAVTATTRPPRQGEIDGHHYHFRSPEEFKRMKEQGELLEWAEVYGYCYGVPKGEVYRSWEQGLDVIVKTDVQGAATIRRLFPEAVLIFLVPPSLKTLEARLRGRGLDSTEALAQRLEAAAKEMEAIDQFNYVVVNEENRLEEAINDVEAIIRAENLRFRPKRDLGGLSQ